MIEKSCSECGTTWGNGVTCEDHFHQMLFWEAEHPDYVAQVHHLMVVCYYIQHPSLYSPEGLRHGHELLHKFLVQGFTPQEVRQQISTKVDSGNRTYKIKGTPTSHGAYQHPVNWTMTAAHVTAAGVDQYCDSVRAWAQATYDALQLSGNLNLA
jgi:hypothetical protein